MISRNASIAIGLILILFVGVAVGMRIRFELEADSIANVACVPFTEEVNITAHAAYLLDLQTGAVLFEKESAQQVPLASLTKIMTALVAHEVLEKDARVTISEESFLPEGDSGFQLGEVWEAGDLIDFTLITSSNDGAHTLALEVSKRKGSDSERFYHLMNLKAQELRLTQTFFLNDTGLDVSSTTSGAYGSAKDVATLLAYANKTAPETFSASAHAQETFTSVSGITHIARHTSAVTAELSGNILAKTGFTDLAGGNLAVIAEPLLGRPFAIVVLQSTRELREADIKTLYDYAKKRTKYDIVCRSYVR